MSDNNGIVAPVGRSFNPKDGLLNLIFGGFLKKWSKNRVVEKIKNFHKSYREFQKQKSELTIFLGLTFAEQLIPIIITWLIALGLGVDIKLVFMLSVFPLTLLVSRLPVSINGIGVFRVSLHCSFY